MKDRNCSAHAIYDCGECLRAKIASLTEKCERMGRVVEAARLHQMYPHFSTRTQLKLALEALTAYEQGGGK